MKRMQWFIPMALAVLMTLMVISLAPTQGTPEAGNGRADLYYNGFRLGGDAGTTIDLLTAQQLTFTGDTSSTTSLTGALPGETYLYFDGWSSTSASTNSTVTYAVTTGTVTATTLVSTTGTLNLLILSLQ